MNSTWAKAKTPAHASVKREPSPSMQLGSLAHAMITNVDIDKHITLPNFNFRSKSSTEKLQSWIKGTVGTSIPDEVTSKTKLHKWLNEVGFTVVSEDMVEAAANMSKAVRSHPDAAKLLEGCNFEVVLVGELHNTTCKARLDGLHRDHILDIKTARDASAEVFGLDFARYAYHIQAAMYTDLHYVNTAKSLPFYFVVVENQPPWGVNVFTPSVAALDIGREELRDAAERWAIVQMMGDFCYPTGIKPLDLPKWYKKRG